MPAKSFKLHKEDLVLQQFKSGIESWEHSKASEVIRTRGAVRTSGSIRSHGAARPSDLKLSEDDPVLKQFKEGIENWERPVKKG